MHYIRQKIHQYHFQNSNKINWQMNRRIIYILHSDTQPPAPPPPKKWKYFHELKILNTEISSFSLLEIRAKSLKAKCTNENCF